MQDIHTIPLSGRLRAVLEELEQLTGILEKSENNQGKEITRLSFYLGQGRHK